jgi:hypothetical protein
MDRRNGQSQWGSGRVSEWFDSADNLSPGRSPEAGARNGYESGAGDACSSGAPAHASSGELTILQSQANDSDK